MSMLRPQASQCAVVTPSHPNLRHQSIPLERDAFTPHRSFPGLHSDLHEHQTSPNNHQGYHSSMPCSLSLNNSNSSLQQISPRALHSSISRSTGALSNSNTSLQQHQQQASYPQSALAPPPPVLGSTRNPSLNLSNSSLQTPACYNNNNNSSGSSLLTSTSIEENPEYVAAAERLTRSMQRSMNSRINVKQNGGLLSGGAMPEQQQQEARDKQQGVVEYHYDPRMQAVPSEEYFRLLHREEGPV